MAGDAERRRFPPNFTAHPTLRTMIRRITHLTVGLFLMVLVAPATLLGEDQPQLRAEDVEFFEAKIRPVLVDHCYECHSAKANEVEGGLMLDNRAAIQRGGDSGPVIEGGDPDASR